MAIPELFSNRRRKELGDIPEVFVYDKLPQPLRVQIVYIIRDGLGRIRGKHGYSTMAYGAFQRIVDTLCRHLGRLSLASGDDPDDIVEAFLLSELNVEYCLDAIELSCVLMEAFAGRFDYSSAAETRLSPGEAIADLNHRFLEHGVGYQYASGRIIRYDSQYLHSEVVKPALALLNDQRYHGANDEFLKAHEHYRKGEIKDCLADSLSALESTLKTICEKRHLPFKATDTVKPLIDICFKNNLIPSFLQSHYSALQSTLESGVPTVRNKLGGHGQGAQVVDVPPHFAAYALHLTASAIQFLIEAEKALP